MIRSLSVSQRRSSVILYILMSMTFWTIDSPELVANYLAEEIGRRLHKGQRVLWLVAGGSAVSSAARASKQLVQEGISLERLTVTLTDERYGKPGHADSNWQQLLDAGFSLPGATLHPVLAGKDMEATATDFEEFLEGELGKVDYRMGLLGIGADGHTSGILPGSSAVQAKGLVHAYDGGDYQRITTTSAALKQLDEAVVYAVGEAKWPVLDQLETDMSIDEQPAQILKHVPKLTICTDKPISQKGDASGSKQ